MFLSLMIIIHQYTCHQFPSYIFPSAISSPLFMSPVKLSEHMSFYYHSSNKLTWVSCFCFSHHLTPQKPLFSSSDFAAGVFKMGFG